ncbi:PKD domain-containing protein [Carboxylicivirga sp. 1411-1]
MKMKIISGISFLMAALLLISCDPNEFDKSGLGLNSAPSDDSMAFTITPKADDPFRFILTNTTPTEGTVLITWKLGNGTVLQGQQVEAYYPLPGTYDLTLTITANNGQSAAKVEQVTQTETDYSFLDSPVLNFLSGGSDAVDGKTWVVDSLYRGHFGIGPAGGDWPEWWAANPLQKTGSGAYDDEFTFKLVEFVFDYKNNGDSYVKDYQKDLPYYSNPVEVDGVDCRVNYTPRPATWTVTERDGVNYLSFSSETPVFLGFDYGGSYEYRIDMINENEVHLSTIGGGPGDRWYNILIRKGYERPVIEKPIEARDLMDDFEGNGNIDWFIAEVEQFGAISNFAPVPINESPNIGIYKKGAFEWTNVAVTLDYRLDLSERNVFSMKVFMPGFNDYVTECNPGTDWLPTHNLMPQIDVKLHDSKLGGDAWTTQQVRGHILSEDQLGKWVELEFDFSDVADRTDFDKIVVQFGMEGHCNPGIFYMDDFMLK